MPITVTQLKAFLAVVRGGSVTAAADDLFVTQPSVSSAIAALSRELGCELFVRSGRGIRLTPAGEAFTPYAADVLGLLDRGRQVARAAAQMSERRLRIAAVTTAAESFVPPLMQAFCRRHPELQLSLDVGNQQYVLDRLRDHRADVAVVGTPPADERLVGEPLLPNAFVCITGPDDPAAGGGPLRAQELAGRRWLLREPGSGTRALVQQFLAARAIDPETLTLGSNGAVKQAARAGLGISLLSRASAGEDLAHGLLREISLSDGPAARPWYLLRCSVGPPLATVTEFFDFVRDEAQRQAG